MQQDSIQWVYNNAESGQEDLQKFCSKGPASGGSNADVQDGFNEGKPLLHVNENETENTRDAQQVRQYL